MIYKYCGFTIFTEHCFPFFHSCSSDKIDIFIKIKKNDLRYRDSSVPFFFNNEKYILNFGEKGYYAITKNQIICYFDDLDYMNVTICNIPMAIVAILNNKIPCHCSSILLKRQIGVVLFMAEKGVGKSTTAFLANNCLDYEIFGDDMVTIERLNGNIYAYQGSSRIKVCKDLAELFNLDNKKDDIYQGVDKCYYTPKNLCSNYDRVHLNNIFILERGSEIKIERVSPYFYKSFLCKNIVGIDIIQGVLIKEISAILNNLKISSMFKLIVPNTIEKLSEHIETIINELEREMK